MARFLVNHPSSRVELPYRVVIPDPDAKKWDEMYRFMMIENNVDGYFTLFSNFGSDPALGYNDKIYLFSDEKAAVIFKLHFG